MRNFLLVTALGVVSFPGSAQSISTSLQPYTSCNFSDGLQIVHLDTLADAPTQRQVETRQGGKTITLLAGERIMFAYPAQDFYANVKAEQLDSSKYTADKSALLGSLELLGKDNVEAKVPPTLYPGFDVHGINREKLEGGVLGAYLIFDDKQHVATTVYLLNQEPEQRAFQSMAEYASRRDAFLKTYTTCIRTNQNTTTLPPKP